MPSEHAPGGSISAPATTACAAWRQDIQILRRTFAKDPKLAVKKTTVRDVPLLYWTAASWGAAIAVSKDDPEMIADQSDRGSFDRPGIRHSTRITTPARSTTS